MNIIELKRVEISIDASLKLDDFYKRDQFGYRTCWHNLKNEGPEYVEDTIVIGYIIEALGKNVVSVISDFCQKTNLRPANWIEINSLRFRAKDLPYDAQYPLVGFGTTAEGESGGAMVISFENWHDDPETIYFHGLGCLEYQDKVNALLLPMV